MPRGGSKPGERRGGRQKGTPNKKTQEKINAIVNSGLTPLDYMLSVLRDESLPDDMRLQAARDSAPYVHPRLSATNMNLKSSSGLNLSIELSK